MSLSISNYISQIVAGQGRKPGPIHDAIQAIQNWASAGLMDADIAANAAIAASKTTIGAYVAPTPWVTPVFYKNDRTTVLSANVRKAIYGQTGKWAWATVNADGIGDTGGINLWMSLPITASFDPTYTINCAYGVNTNGATAYVSYALIGTTDGIKTAIRLGADNAWGNAGNNTVNMTFWWLTQ